jgi:hypothetical protein
MMSQLLACCYSAAQLLLLLLQDTRCAYRALCLNRQPNQPITFATISLYCRSQQATNNKQIKQIKTNTSP